MNLGKRMNTLFKILAKATLEAFNKYMENEKDGFLKKTFKMFKNSLKDKAKKTSFDALRALVSLAYPDDE
jgi:DNA anti-recombination protein RmuC